MTFAKGDLINAQPAHPIKRTGKLFCASMKDPFNHIPQKILPNGYIFDRSLQTALIEIGLITNRRRAIGFYKRKPFAEIPITVGAIKLSLLKTEIDFPTGYRQVANRATVVFPNLLCLV